MAAKLLILALLAAVVSQGQGLTEITLPEETINYISSDLIGRSFTIPKWWFDTLVSCHIVFPNGGLYQAYPEDTIPHDNFNYMTAVAPFNACAVSFRGIGLEYAGTYTLMSLVEHSDKTMSLTTQKFVLNIQMSEVEIPRKQTDENM